MFHSWYQVRVCVCIIRKTVAMNHECLNPCAKKRVRSGSCYAILYILVLVARKRVPPRRAEFCLAWSARLRRARPCNQDRNVWIHQYRTSSRPSTEYEKVVPVSGVHVHTVCASQRLFDFFVTSRKTLIHKIPLQPSIRSHLDSLVPKSYSASSNYVYKVSE